MQKFEIFRRYLLYLFPPRSPQKKQLADLVTLWKELNNENPQFFEPIRNRLTGKMGSLLVLLKKTIDPFKSNTQFMHWKPDDTNINIVWKHLLKHKELTPHQMNFSHVLTQNEDADLTDVDTIFQSNMAKVTLEDIEFWDNQIIELLFLQKLTAYPFYELLVHWNRGDRDIAYAPAEECTKLLTDLYGLLKPISGNFAHGILISLFFPELPKQSFQDLYRFINKLTAGNHFKKLIQALHKGKLPTIKLQVNTPHYLNDLRNEVQEKYNRDKQKEQKARETRILMNNIKEIFGSENLLLPRCYNSNTSFQLEKMGLKPLLYLSQVKLMQNFFNLYYIGHLMDALHFYQLDLSGKYSEPENSLFYLLDQYNELEKKMSVWEKNQESSGFSDFGSLDTIIKINLMMLPVKQMLNKRMKQLEEETLSLIEQFAKTMKHSIGTLKALTKSLLPLQHEIAGEKKQGLQQCIRTFQLYNKKSEIILNMLDSSLS